jgi:prepilin-type N-terminal cleavage/methylation domain-containing protein
MRYPVPAARGSASECSGCNQFPNNHSCGFTIMEVLVAIAITGFLASIAIPHYLDYRKKALAAACASNRYHIEMAERAYYLSQNKPGLKMDDGPFCPSGGVYVWIASDPNDPDYPEMICSVHGEVRSNEAEPLTSLGTTFEEIAGEMISLTGQFFEEHGRYPRSWGDYRYTDIGLDPAAWAASYDGLIYTPIGNRIAIEPAEGFIIFVKDAEGIELVLTPELNWSLLYSMEDNSWYFKNISSGRKIDISSLKVVEG